ncbi:MAG: Epimerase family protein [Chlamydiae bacterium]|nr:Epimerase family protein [Chlamydiota bacterium]
MASKSKFRFRSLVNRSAKDLFAWHLRARVLERSIPPWEDVEVLSSEGRADQPGSKIVVKARIFGPYWRKIELEYREYVPNDSFKAVQIEGFFSHYEYKTTVTPQSEHTCEVVDQFEFSHNFPKILSPFINRSFEKRFSRMLLYRHEIIDNDLGLLEKYPFERPLKILITGSHGLIGKSLFHFLEFAGHEVWHLARSKSDHESHTIVWDPKTGRADREQFENFDAVINLAGESIAKGRWTKRKKERILKSRYKGTEHLVEILKQLKNPPKTFINASAVGYYGDRGSEVVNEKSDPGKGLFLSEVCEYWERASKDLEERGTRVIQTRFGVVLTSAGGALKQMLIPFKWGLGGKFGRGDQYLSWISIDDVIGALYHVMMTPSLDGPVNLVSPHPIPNSIFCKTLAKRLNRWIGPPMPEFIVHHLFGQKGDELLLASTRVEPSRLIETGYTFRYPKLPQALEHIV